MYILTIYDMNNYGNRLQNYALSEVLSSYGDVYTIRSYPNILSSFDYIKYLFSYVKNMIKRIVFLRDSSAKALLYKRTCRNVLFTKKNIISDSFYTSYTGLKGKAKKDAQIVIGSDQVWNYQWISHSDLCFRLCSFSCSSKNIAYAASFGVSEINDEARLIFRKYLPRLKAISVREDRGAELVREMTGLEATVVLDPTLMLTADKWLEIAEGFVPDNDRYVLTYFLGRPSDEQERDIQAYAKAYGCRVRRMLDLRDKETYVAGPQDFVELFSKAQYVFTDSYHACCFSILFHKQFTVFNRAGMTGKSSMNSRMETLFRLFDLDSVMMDSGLAPEIDYAKVDRLLDQHRRESQVWLDKAMEE